MPNKFVTLDTGFPTFSNSASTTEKVDGIMSYLYQMQESLRYMFRHLDSENFDEAGLRSITDPIAISLREDFNSTQLDIDASGIEAVIEGLETTLSAYVKSDVFQVTIEGLDDDISSLTQTVEGFELRVENTEGDVSSLTQTVKGLSSTVSGYDGRISKVEQTASSLSSTVSGFDGRISTVEQTASSLKTTVSSQNGKISSLEQTVNGFDTRVSNAEGDISSLSQTVDSFELSVSSSSTGSSTFTLKADGATLSTKTLNMYVKSTNIYGKLTADQIEVDDLAAGLIVGDTVYIEDTDGYTAGYFQTTDTSLGSGLLLEGANGLKLTSPGNVLIRSHVRSGTVYTPEIILQWTDPNDATSAAITMQGGALILGSEMFGNNIPYNPQYGQVYFYGPV